MEDAYLKATVGPALVECLGKIALAHPADPIESLSARLREFARHDKAKAEVISHV